MSHTARTRKRQRGTSTGTACTRAQRPTCRRRCRRSHGRSSCTSSSSSGTVGGAAPTQTFTHTHTQPHTHAHTHTHTHTLAVRHTRITQPCVLRNMPRTCTAQVRGLPRPAALAHIRRLLHRAQVDRRGAAAGRRGACTGERRQSRVASHAVHPVRGRQRQGLIVRGKSASERADHLRTWTPVVRVTADVHRAPTFRHCPRHRTRAGSGLSGRRRPGESEKRVVPG